MGNRFFAFSLIEGIFCLRKSFVPLLKFQVVFGDGDEKRIVSTALKHFSPWVSQRQKTKYSNSFWKNKYRLSAEHGLGFINQGTTSNSMRLTQTITHTCTCTLCLSPCTKNCKTSVSFQYRLVFSEKISVQPVGLLQRRNHESLNSCRIKQKGVL